MERSVSREGAASWLNTAAASLVTVVLLLLPPASYSVVSYLNLASEMDREAILRGQAVNQAIAASPQSWARDRDLLQALLSLPPDYIGHGRLAIFDSDGAEVASVGTIPSHPMIVRVVPLQDAGTTAGRLEIAYSLRTLLRNTIWLLIAGVALAAGAFVTLHVVPLNALRRANTILQQRDSELAFANTVLTTAMDGAPDGILIVDENKKIIAANDRFAEMWDVPHALVHARDDIPVLAVVRSRTKDPDAFEARVDYLYRHPNETSHDRIDLKDGRIFDRHSRALYDAQRHYLGRIWFFRDITEREALVDDVRRSEQKFRNLVEATPDFIWEIDADNRFTYVSPNIRSLLGFQPEELLGKTPFEFMSPEEARRVSSITAPILAARQPLSILDNAILRKDGSEVPVETSAVPFFDAAGNFCGYRGIDRDMTQRKIAMRALQQRDALLHAVALGATELATAASVEDAIGRTLHLVNDVLKVDRITIVEDSKTPGEPPTFQHGWSGPTAPAELNAAFFDSEPHQMPGMMAWLAPLRNGQFVLTNTRTTAGAIRSILERLGVKTALLVPITVDGRYWGFVGFDTCEAERQWEPFEIEILRTLTDLVGNAIQRERYVKELRDAMRIVQDTPTILYRLTSGPAMAMSYISQNIKLFGYSPEALISSPRLFLTIIHPDDLPKVRDALTVALENGSKSGMVEHRILTTHGDHRWVENRYTPVRDQRGRLLEIEGILVDITERRLAEEKIAQLARTDSLTGLANRATFIERLRLAFAASRRGALPFAVLYLDLDRFKDINDTLGHPLGDLLLKAVAGRLAENARETDLVARPGGDEFAILQSDVSETADAGALAAKLRAAIAAPIEIEGNQLHITASVGIAIYTPEILAAEDMLARADLALYRAKEEGRDQYRFHSEQLDQQVRMQVAMADELRNALERNEFELYYQPQVALATGRIVGMEALLRWNHPTRGQLHPLAFIPTAEKAGSMAAIGKWVLDHACEQMAAWRSAGIAPATIAANVSLAQLKTGGEFYQFVISTLQKWRLAPSDLELDVTESMLAHATLSQNDVLERLQQLGVKIAIDDFGTKYSSLDYLRTYRVSRLKISKSMVDAAARNSGNAAMVRAITSIARELNVEVVAQGVETEAEWSFLTAASPSSSVQGYFYSMPVPAIRAGQLLLRGVIRPADEEKPASA